MKALYLLVLTTLLLICSGCQLLQTQPSVSQSVVVVTEQPNEIEGSEEQSNYMLDDIEPTKPDYVPMNHFVKLDDYVEQMAIELSDLLHSSHNESIDLAIASFVRFDGTLQTTNQLGNQLTETFKHQLHRFGYQVVDTKLLDGVLINRMGEYVFSRDTKFKKTVADYVLSGTMLYREKGVLINARVMSLENKKVIATSSKVIPWYVLQSENILASVN